MGRAKSRKGGKETQQSLRHARLVGAHLRALRTHQGLSTVALAQRVGCTQQHVSSVELGRINTPIETVGKFAEALGLQLHDVLCPAARDTSDISHTERPADEDLDTDLVEVLSAQYEALGVTLLRLIACQVYSHRENIWAPLSFARMPFSLAFPCPTC